jgi:hypothetical protein
MTAVPGAEDDNRVYYRGTVPGEKRRIPSGDAWWRGHLFVAARIETALSYGSDIETVVFCDDARILMARTEQIAAVEAAAGAVRAKGEALAWASAVARQAERGIRCGRFPLVHRRDSARRIRCRPRLAGIAGVRPRL